MSENLGQSQSFFFKTAQDENNSIIKKITIYFFNLHNAILKKK